MLSFGLYEQIINNIMQQHLDQISTEMIMVQTGKIDSAESSKILSVYLALVIRDVLDYIDGENGALDNRIALCNNLIEYIAAAIEKGASGFRPSCQLADLVRNKIIHTDAKLLLALLDKKGSKTVLNPQKATLIRPDTSIAENSLFTGAILKDYNFGSLMVGGSSPDSLDHLFVSIQSLNSRELTSISNPDHYDYIIIDEFHHAAAPSYEELLTYYQPRILLGLTATPERPDGKNVFQYFNGRISAELRLNEAIERKLLSPFHYFGVTDTVSLQNVQWTAGKYDQKQLDNLYVFESSQAQRRVGNIIRAIDNYCTDRSDIIGLGFCVSKDHARYMADCFNQAGIAAEYLVAESEESVRSSVRQRLVNKEIKFIFVVDLYNEGVDIPEINTVLFLRPTESLTVFIQQLGRGLRLCEGKEALTVLDFVGQANRKFNFEERFRALLARTRRTVEYEIEHGFIHVPRGCSIQMERQAQEYILENIKNTINNKKNIKLKLIDYFEIHKKIEAQEFFEDYHVQPLEIYCWDCSLSSLAAEAVLLVKYSVDDKNNRIVASAFLRLSSANSRRWITYLLDILPRIKSNHGYIEDNLSGIERTMLTMFHYTVYGKGLDDLDNTFSSIEAAIYNVSG